MLVKGVNKIFGTDGVRGKANQLPMTVETAVALGKAAGVIFRRHNGKHRVVIGKDTRLSCYMFENALIAGLCSMGVDTLMVGPLPTPGVAFITRAYRADAGIVISASHNAFHDNGIKFFSSEGFKLSDEWEAEMEALIAENDFERYLPSDENIGRNKKIDDAQGRYIEFVKATFPRGCSLKGFKVALDCANGAAYKVAPCVFKELDAEVLEHGIHPNGLNINKECGALCPEKLQRIVIEQKADVGVALDGDGDRLMMIDETGAIVDGDAILAICAEEMSQKGQLYYNTVVGTVMTNMGIEKYLESKGIQMIRSKVGDRHVIADMVNHGANLGGEQSGHLIFLDHNSTGDGLVSALQVLRIMQESGSKLSELVLRLKRYPQELVNIQVKEKPPIETLSEVVFQIELAKKELANKGRVLVRYSGTENLCRVMVEGEDKEQVLKTANSIAQAVKQSIGI